MDYPQRQNPAKLLERLLYRLVASGYDGDFVLKGAMLFAIWRDIPDRPTRDVDLLGLGDVDHERLRKVFTDACIVDRKSVV